MRRPFLLCLVLAAVVCGSPSATSAAGANVLSAPHASPPSGTILTPFSLGVTYEGGFPALSVTVSVAGTTLPMLLVDGGPTHGTWSVTTFLPQGSWATTFRAVASQGKSPSTVGPAILVGEMATPSVPTPTKATTVQTPAAEDPGSTPDGGGAPPAGTQAPAAPVATEAPSGGSAGSLVPPAGSDPDPTPAGAPVGPATPARGGDAPRTTSDGVPTRAAPGSPGWRGTPGAASAREGETWTGSASSPTGIGSPPTDEATDPLAVAVPIGAIAALALLAGFVMLAGRRRRPQVATEDAVAAALHRRMIRRARVRLHEEPLAGPEADPVVHPARRSVRRPPTR